MGETKTKVTETTEPKNIYAKMASVKSKLIGLKKGGKNEFSHYNYFELGDILPVLTPALEEERLFMQTQFSAMEQIAKLIIIDIDIPESKIEFEIKFAECALKGAHEIQNLGAAQTYTRRYLIMTAFDIAEADIVDGGAELDEEKAAQKKNQQTPPQDELAQLRRNTWELIKKLPADDQVKWINQCGGANAQTLKKIYLDVNAILNAPPPAKPTPQPQTPPQENDPLDSMKAEYFKLIETLPAEVQIEWLDAGYDADEAKMTELLTKLKEQIKTFEGERTPQGKQNEGQRLAEQAANQGTAPEGEIKPNELEIY